MKQQASLYNDWQNPDTAHCVHRLTLAGDFTNSANTLPLSRVMDAR